MHAAKKTGAAKFLCLLCHEANFLRRCLHERHQFLVSSRKFGQVSICILGYRYGQNSRFKTQETLDFKRVFQEDEACPSGLAARLRRGEVEAL